MLRRKSSKVRAGVVHGAHRFWCVMSGAASVAVYPAATVAGHVSGRTRSSVRRAAGVRLDASMDRAHVPVGADVPGSLVLDADAVEANRLRRSKRLRASRDPEQSPHASVEVLSVRYNLESDCERSECEGGGLCVDTVVDLGVILAWAHGVQVVAVILVIRMATPAVYAHGKEVPMMRTRTWTWTLILRVPVLQLCGREASMIRTRTRTRRWMLILRPAKVGTCV